MTKKMRTVLFFLLSLSLCVVLVISFLMYKKAAAREFEMEKGLAILKQEKAQIYISGFYLNGDTKKWQDKSLTIGNGYPLCISRQKIVYMADYYHPKNLIVADIQNTKKCISVEVDGGGIVISDWGYNVSLSNDANTLAYVIYPDTQRKEKPNLVICDLSNLKKKVYPQIGMTQVICWSNDDKSIIFCDYRDIYRLNVINGNLEIITTGFLPKVLPGSSLGFWDYKEPNTFCCKIDLNTGKRIELFSLEGYLRGADWSPNGRYVIAYVLSDYFFIRECVGLPILIDTEKGRKYRLPETTSSRYAEKPFKDGEDVMWK
jgi:hypothetical protein